MIRFIAFLGLLLALAAGARPVDAYPLGQRAPILTPGACAGVRVKTDFAAGVYCMNGGRYGSFAAMPGASVSRNSAETCQWADGHLSYVTSGQPCITDLGVGVWQASTNLLNWSQTFTNVAWSPVAAATADNQTAAPDLAVTAGKLIENAATTTQHRIDQSVTFSAAAYTFSVYAKPSGRTWAQLRINLNGAFFDIQHCVLGSVDTGVTATVTPAANGFCRLTITYTPTAGASAARINLASGDQGANYTGDGVSGAFIWGADLEQLAFATPYIPTTSSSVTRAADVIFINGLNITNGTLFASATPAALSQTFRRVASLNDNTVSNEAYVGIGGSGNAFGWVAAGGVSQANFTLGAWSGQQTVALSFAAGAQAISFAGGAVTTSAGSSTPPATYLSIGQIANGAGAFSGWIQRVRVTVPPMSNSQLPGLQ